MKVWFEGSIVYYDMISHGATPHCIDLVYKITELQYDEESDKAFVKTTGRNCTIHYLYKPEITCVIWDYQSSTPESDVMNRLEEKYKTALYIAELIEDPFVAITLEELYNDRKRLIEEVERLTREVSDLTDACRQWREYTEGKRNEIT